MIDFRPLAREDFPMLCDWLNQPHMKKFYQPSPITLDQVIKKFTSRVVGFEPTSSHVAMLDGIPFGKIQSYKNTSYPDYASVIGVSEGISVDLFIGNPSFLGKGIGREMLLSYVTKIAFPTFFDEENCYICHQRENRTALKTSKSCGFQYLRDVVEEGVLSELLVLQRSQCFGGRE